MSTEVLTKNDLSEVKDWLPSCPSCNIVLETKDAEARSKGLKKSKFIKTHKS